MSAIRTGCVLIIEKKMFKGSWRKPKYDGEVVMKVKVISHSYGSQRGQHTFTCEIIEIISRDTPQNKHYVGEKFLIKGRNLYPNVLEHVRGEESLKVSNF